MFLIGIELVDLAGMRAILRLRPDEFVVAAVTAVVVVIVGVEQGILLAMALSIIDHLRHSYEPYDTLLADDRTATGITTAPVDGGGQAGPGPGRCTASASGLYYANANLFTEEIRDRRRADPPLRMLWSSAPRSPTSTTPGRRRCARSTRSSRHGA